MSNTSEKTNNVPAEVALEFAGSPRRWVVNTNQFNPALNNEPVRFNEKLTDAQVRAILKSQSLVSAVKNAVSKGMAVAVTEKSTYMLIGKPTNQLSIGTSSQGATPQDTSLAGVASQTQELLLRAVDHEALKKPARNSEISAIAFKDGVASFTMTCKNGASFTITVKENK